jgi:hypothetical protein
MTLDFVSTIKNKIVKETNKTQFIMHYSKSILEAGLVNTLYDRARFSPLVRPNNQRNKKT